MRTKVCTGCGKKLPATLEFFHKGNDGFGLRHRCKECRKKVYEENKDEVLKKRKDYYEKNKDQIRIQQLQYRKTEAGKKSRNKYTKSEKGRKIQRKYIFSDKGRRTRKTYYYRKYFNISLEELTTLLEKQDYRCAVCGTLEPGGRHKKFSLDHDHETGKIRGLLCDKCNRGLGYFNDNIEVLKRAIKYLEDRRFK